MRLVPLASVCAALFLAACLFSHTVALRLILLFAGCALVAAAALRARWQGAPGAISFLPPLALPFALWAAWAGLSLLWSVEPELTDKELRNEIGYAFLAHWLCYVGAQAAIAPRLFGATLGLGALAVAAVATFYLTRLEPHIRAVHGGPGTYSSTLLVLVPCTLAFVWLAWRRRWHAGLLAGAVLLPLFALSSYATFNRTVWIAIAAQLALLAWFAWRWHGTALTRLTKVIAGVAALAAVAGAIAMAAQIQNEREQRLGARGALQADARPLLWRFTLRQIAERPLAGSGFGRGIARTELKQAFGNPQLWHSHNLFVDTALQVGLVGLALLLVLLGWTGTLAWRLLRSRSEVAAACGIALAAVLAGMLIRNMTDLLWVRQSALLYWGIAGALLGWGVTAARKGAAAPA